MRIQNRVVKTVVQDTVVENYDIVQGTEGVYGVVLPSKVAHKLRKILELGKPQFTTGTVWVLFAGSNYPLLFSTNSLTVLVPAQTARNFVAIDVDGSE